MEGPILAVGSWPFMMPLTATAMLSNCVLMLTNGRGQVAINSGHWKPLGGPGRHFKRKSIQSHDILPAHYGPQMNRTGTHTYTLPFTFTIANKRSEMKRKFSFMAPLTPFPVSSLVAIYAALTSWHCSLISDADCDCRPWLQQPWDLWSI